MQQNATPNLLESASGQVCSFLTYIESLISQIINMVTIVIVEAFFLPIFSLILTVVSARELAKILGSELSFGKFDIF